MDKMIVGLEEKGETVLFPTLDRAVRTLSRLRRYHQHVSGDGG